MQNSAKIQAKECAELMGQLLDDRTLIKMRMLGRGFERLTLIVEVCTDKNQERFRIDYPSGFRESADGGDPWQLVFEFTGRDKVPYRFKTTGGRLEGDAVWLPMPDFIERRQRRRHFRVETDMGSRLFFRLEEVPRELNLINVSLSGALGTLVRLKKEVLKTPPMAVGHFLEDVRLVFPGDAQEVCVSVEKAVVRRVEKTPKELFAYALEFVNVSAQDEKTLKNEVYRLQRKFLQSRSLRETFF